MSANDDVNRLLDETNGSASFLTIRKQRIPVTMNQFFTLKSAWKDRHNQESDSDGDDDDNEKQPAEAGGAYYSNGYAPQEPDDEDDLFGEDSGNPQPPIGNRADFGEDDDGDDGPESYEPVSREMRQPLEDLWGKYYCRVCKYLIATANAVHLHEKKKGEHDIVPAYDVPELIKQARDNIFGSGGNTKIDSSEVPEPKLANKKDASGRQAQEGRPVSRVIEVGGSYYFQVTTHYTPEAIALYNSARKLGLQDGWSQFVNRCIVGYLGDHGISLAMIFGHLRKEGIEDGISELGRIPGEIRDIKAGQPAGF